MIRTLLLAALIGAAAPALASETQGPSPQASAPTPNLSGWREEKCARYRAAWTQALSRFGRAGLSAAFLERHDAFLARGCEPPRDVCPSSKEELALANVMVLRAMNAGAASTFPPFACPR